MQLTKGEFSQFNLKSKMQLLNSDGILLFKKKVNEQHELQLFFIYNFFVEMFFNYYDNKAVNIEPVADEKRLAFYRHDDGWDDLKQIKFSEN